MIVLDAWAVVALLKDEPASPRVERALEEQEALISAVNLGESQYTLVKEGRDRRTVEAAIDVLRRTIRIDLPDWPLVRAAARLKGDRPLSYADAFCVATAQRHRATLWTGDPEILALSDVVDVVDLREAGGG